ncbi:nucleoside-diphosphate sugar epimerase/dehydratase (plasmid) [Cetobacterium somerae]|uniref:polysaccharide biosynthesis protein n=1 Tax=Cetobacterium somerae TaxID=188913 RepID=UPI002E7AF25A|nr:nucleoside-diphosphate sugar epimerase/dehydratase [Cetobacterium somerae]WVJ02319.1 nucleoside-diphosphate sugar epimerase/dehydratase [Cetobacterium somerae]
MVEEKLLDELLSNKRNFVKLGIDSISIILGVIFALLARFESFWLLNAKKEYIFIYGSFFLMFYLFKRDGIKSWSFTNSLDVLNLLFTHLLTVITMIVYMSSLNFDYSRGIVLLTGIFAMILQLSGRFMFRLNRTYKIPKKGMNLDKKTIVVYGAGEMGVQLIREAKINRDFQYNIVGLIDDDLKKRGTYLNGVKVLGNIDELEEILDRKKIESLIIAISNIEKDSIKSIVERCRQQNVKVKILPQVGEILSNDKLSNQIRDVSIEDLLGREQILVNGDSIEKLINNKVVFVTGGAGSIGSELARQIARHNPQKLITIDVNENDLYFLELELKRKYKNLNLQSEICNIREQDKLEILFKRYRPNLVFHAAAHKHVPLMEHNPEEAIKNNIFGTKNVSEMAIKYGVERFVLISTDKAVNPTNIMGATKRACELVVEEMNKRSETKFMAVRFGNVLGSNGSVIPIFKKLISEGKNLTLTHPDITRYFMTIPEAAQLVIEAGALGNGGELFILDMGAPIKIMDLAKTMIELSNAPVNIEIVGLRPGEKLYEELLYDINKATKTDNNKIFITDIDRMNVDLEYHLEKLKIAIKDPKKDELKDLMKKFVQTYREGSYEKGNQPISA